LKKLFSIKNFLRDTHKNTVLVFVFFVFLALIGLFSIVTSREPTNSGPRPSTAASNLSVPSEKSIDKTRELKTRLRKNEKRKPNLPPLSANDEKDIPRKRIMVRGLVVNKEGDGVSQAQVFLFPLARSATSFSCKDQSNGKGFFAIKDVPLGDFKLFAQKGNSRSRQLFGSSLGEDVEGVRIVVPTTGKIIGVIRNTSGETIPKVTISMFPMGESEPQPRSARHLKSQSDGSFQIESLDLNTPVKLHFSKRGFLDSEERIDFAAGLDTYPLEIVMEESGWIHGRVTDEDGNPVYKAKIYLRGTEKLRLQFSQTDRDGFFKAGYLREPLHNLIVLAKDFAPKKLTAIPLNHPELTIVLTGGGTISGRAVFGQVNPSQPFTIEAIPSNPSGIEQYNQYQVRSFHNPENVFTLDRLPPGEYTLKVEGRGWALTYQEPVYVGENGVIEDIVIPVEQGVQLAGRAYKGDAGDDAFPSVLIHLVKAAGPYVPFISEVSDNNGKFVFRRIPQGSYLVVAGRCDFRYKSAKFSLEPGTEYDEFSIVLKNDPDIDLPSPIDPPIVGIGVILQRFENVVKIEKALSGGPAAIAELQKGDLIVEVDHYPIEGSLLSEIIDRVRGEVNTIVMLGIERDGYFFQEEIVRNRIGY